MRLLGAIAGDMIGAPYEHQPIKTVDFPLFSPASRFTDDTVLTVAIADALLNGGDYVRSLERYFYRYPTLPYGGGFYDWATSHDHRPYNSWGNGSAMRVSPVAYAATNVASVLAEAERSAQITHNHPEGIKGAQATALAVFLARKQSPKEEIRKEIESRFGYNLSRSLEQIGPGYVCDLSCQHTVPEAFICFFESTSFEDAVRKAVSLGGDADTMACIAGSMAEAFYGGVPRDIEVETLSRLDDGILDTLTRFTQRFGNPGD